MNPRTLIIDDDPLVATSIRTQMELLDHEVLLAHTGEEGLALVEEQPLDLVISDIQLPGVNGDEVMRTIRKTHPELPVILVTAHGAVKDAVRAIQDGAFQYLLKPIDLDELEVSVERALEATHLRRENRTLRAELAGHGTHGVQLIGSSPAMVKVHDLILRVARSDSTVLITGETGTGKEMIAQTVHYRSPRAKAPLVAFNCAAFNENLMESELFGHEKGAFTGANQARRGRFEEADGGTIFLDEIGETSKAFQARLLRVLQEREFERVGGNRKVAIDVRVIASTNRDLETEVEEDRFREDLYYRLRVVPIHLPPLRERRDDILPLAAHFLASYAEQYSSPVTGFSEACTKALENQPWPGNVRELKHAVERAVVLATRDVLEPEDLEFGEGGVRPAAETSTSQALQDVLEETSREHVIKVLDQTDWRKQAAAEILGIDRATLYRMIRKYQIEKAREMTRPS